MSRVHVCDIDLQRFFVIDHAASDEDGRADPRPFFYIGWHIPKDSASLPTFVAQNTEDIRPSILRGAQRNFLQ